MSLLPLFEWIDALALSIAIRESDWFYAIVQAVHLLALAVFAGALLMVDLRLLGAGLKTQPRAQVARDAERWLIGGFLVLCVTGVPQLMGTAMKQYYSDMFWLKMEVLLVALVFTLTVRRWVALADEDRVRPMWGKLVGLVSMGLWLGVAVPARLIGFF